MKLRVIILAVVLAVSVVSAADARPRSDWKQAACTFYVAHYHGTSYPLLRGVNPHTRVWGPRIRRLARWEQTHTGLRPTGQLDRGLRRLLRPYLPRR